MTALVKTKIENGEKPNGILNLTSAVVSHNTVLTSPVIMAKGDSAASKHYWRPQDKKVLDEIEQCLGPSVLLPNNTTIVSTKKGQVPFSSDLSKEAKTAQILPRLASSSLISLGQLCDDDCVVLLNKKQLLAIKDKNIVLQGIRNPIDRLWDIPVGRHNIIADNYQIPNIHPGMYASKQGNTSVKSLHADNILKVSSDNIVKK